MHGPNPKVFLALAALGLVGASGATFYQWQGLGEQTSKVESLRTQVSEAATVRKRLEESDQRLSEVQVKLAHLERGISDYQYVPTLLRELETFGNANGIQVTGIKPIPKPPTTQPTEKKTQTYDDLIIEVKARGSYGDAMRFLRALHRFPKAVAARTVTLTPFSDGQPQSVRTPNLDMTLELRVFVFPAESAPSVKVADGKESSANG